MFCSGDKMVKNSMGEAFSGSAREERCIQGFDAETRGKETTWESQA
jgi:hypothetical protein